jgi:hypothetical protein
MQHHRRRQWAGAVAIVALYTQYTIFLMALPEEKEKAHWNELEVSGHWSITFTSIGHKLESGETSERKHTTLQRSTLHRTSLRVQRRQERCAKRNGLRYVHHRWSFIPRKLISVSSDFR